MSEFQFLGGDLPPEIKQHFERVADHNAMTAQAAHLEYEAFWESVTPDQTRFLIKMFGIAAQDGGYASYITGKLESMLKYRFDLCNCGKPNGHQFMMDAIPDPNRILAEQDEQLELPFVEEVNEDLDPQMSLEEVDKIHGLLADYKLVMLLGDDETVSMERQVECKNCNMVFSSLRDRIIKPTEPCDGCIQMTKWG
jgi:hypothetical protein